MARHLGARVFEDASYQEITRENAEQILDPNGKLVTEQDEFWKKSVTSMEERLLAPIEYPVGRYDALNDYFVLFLDPPSAPLTQQLLNPQSMKPRAVGITGGADDALVSISTYNLLAASPLAANIAADSSDDAKKVDSGIGDLAEDAMPGVEKPGDSGAGTNGRDAQDSASKVRQIDMPALAHKLGLSVAPDSVAPERFALQDPISGSILALALLRPNDGAIQIRPFYWMEPFSRVAAETLKLAKALRNELGGTLLLRDKPISPQFETAIEANINGLGVEFYFWLQSPAASASIPPGSPIT